MSEPLDHSKEITQVNPGPKPLWNAGIREFFMLFLAVFCGFLAENYREKLADNEAEKQSMELLAKSLKSDTLELSKTIRMYNERGLFVDSFIHLKDSDFSLSENRRLFFKYTIMGMLNSRFFNINQSGFEQLKYSGTIRQVSNQEILQRLGVYYNAYQTEILAEENDYKIWYQHTIPRLMEVTDYSIFGGGKPGFIFVLFPQMNISNQPIPAIKMNADQKQSLFGFAANLQIADEAYAMLLEEQKKRADTLITMLNSEYSIRP